MKKTKRADWNILEVLEYNWNLWAFPEKKKKTTKQKIN